MRLLVSCPDRPGIVAAVARFLLDAGANITSSEQHTTDPAAGTFFLRVQFTVDRAALEGLAVGFGVVAERFEMRWRLWDDRRRKRVAVLVSRHDHCLQDLIWSHLAQERPRPLEGRAASGAQDGRGDRPRRRADPPQGLCASCRPRARRQAALTGAKQRRTVDGASPADARCAMYARTSGG